MYRTETNDTWSRGPVTCTACGCRLAALSGARDGEYRHFEGFEGRDARGCSVECVDRTHDATGAPIPEPVTA